MTVPASALPLRGVRVLDLGWLLPAPFASAILSDLGADVIKIERPGGGDYLRELSPALFTKINAGKRSVTLDLKQKEDLDKFLALARTADVVMESFRPGVAKRLGIDPDNLRALRPDLVYVSLSGFGQTGPLAQQPGHDINYLALAGALSIPGHWGQPARRNGIPLGDLASSLYAVINVLAALRNRDAGQGGASIDVAIAESVLHWSNTRFGDFQPQVPDDPWAHVHPANDVFTTADGRGIALGLIEVHFWNNFCAAADRPRMRELIHRPGVQGKRALQQALVEAVGSRTLSDWQERFVRWDVPYSVVHGPAEVLAEPQFLERHMLAVAEDAAGTQVSVVALPGRAFGHIFHEPGRVARAPTEGEHTEELLGIHGD